MELSTAEKKKHNEIAAVRRVIEHVIGATDVLLREHESPDVLADGDGLRVAIEVVEPTDERMAAGLAGLHRLKKALLAALERRGLHVLVDLGTVDGFIADLNDGARLRQNVDALVSLADEHVRLARPRHEYRYAELCARKIERLINVRIDHARTPSVFTRARTRHAGGCIRDRVQCALTDKNARVASYRARVGDRPVWLVVLAGLSFASGAQSDSVRTGEYVSLFDRTFYVDAYDQASFELRTRTA